MESDEDSVLTQHEQHRKRFDLAHSWTNTVAGIAALSLAVFNFITIHREPDIDITLPHTVRLGQYYSEGYMYIQPTFSTRLSAEKVEMITDVKLDIRRSGKSGQKPSFFWDEFGVFQHDPERDNVGVYQKVSDPSPFIVSQNRPQQPVILFAATGGWKFEPGRYNGTLTFKRESTSAPLVRNFCLSIEKEDIPLIEKNVYWSFRNDLPAKNSSSPSESKDCYSLPRL